MASSKAYLDFILEQLSKLEEITYDGVKEMLLIEDVDNKEFLAKLFKAMYDALPIQKKKQIMVIQ